MWANMHLLFWLSLVPFSAGSLGRSGGQHSKLRDVVGSDLKEHLSIGSYVVGIGAANVDVRLSWSFFAVVAISWLVPDRRVTRALRD